MTNQSSLTPKPRTRFSAPSLRLSNPKSSTRFWCMITTGAAAGVSTTNWDDVILDDKMKKTLTGTVLRFFDSETKYREFGVPWKRGLIFYGPPGNGKTISLKALMHSLFQREDQRRVVPLYVKSMEASRDVRQVFQVARQQAPCLLILEDIDTLVNEKLRSYFVSCSVSSEQVSTLPGGSLCEGG
jgi:SpoVK/Ycf46/Vps4 family AAA+-type ATPase